MNDNKAEVKVFRFDPTIDKEPRYETYEIPYEAWGDHKITDVLQYICENFSPDLAYREACYQGLCGCCTVRVNNKPVLACEEFAEQQMVIEPLKMDQVLKDLVVIR
jgi:succinate dehydrogenase/fumarate reductase iron-sulfur protein